MPRKINQVDFSAESSSMQSLAARHPWRLDIPLLLSLSIVLLTQGVTTPAMD